MAGPFPSRVNHALDLQVANLLSELNYKFLFGATDENWQHKYFSVQLEEQRHEEKVADIK